jgi:hypothetical protein
MQSTGSCVEMAEIETVKNLAIVQSRFSQHLELRNAHIGGTLALTASRFADTHQPALWLTGASIGRDLELLNADIKGAMVAERVVIGGDAKLDGAHFRLDNGDDDRSIVLTDAAIKGRLRMTASGPERAFLAEARVDLVSAHVGDLLAKGGRFLGTEHPALVCDQIKVDNTVDLSGTPDGRVAFEACEGVRFNAARIGGQVQIYDGHFASAAMALTFQGAKIAGDVTLGFPLRDTVIDGELDLSTASIGGRFVMERLIVNGRPEAEFAIAVRQANIGGELAIHALRARGALRFDTSRIDGIGLSDIIVTRAVPEADLSGLPQGYSHPLNTLVDLHHVKTRTDVHIEELYLRGGDLRLLGADIGGEVQISRFNIEGAAGRSIVAQEMRVRGGLNLQGTPDRRSALQGEVNFLNVEFGSGITFANVDIGTPDDPTSCLLRRAKVQGDIAFHQMTIHGGLDVSATTVKGDIRAESCEIRRSGEIAFNANSAEIGGALEWTSANGKACVIDGRIDADGASVGIVRWDGLEVADGAQMRLTNMHVSRAVQADSITGRGETWLILTGTETPALIDTLAEDHDGWGAGAIHLALDGFSYGRLQKPSGRQEDDPRTIRKWRGIWFDRRGDQRSSRPLRHLSAVLKRQGLYEASRRTLMDAFALESWTRSPYGGWLSRYFGLFFGHGLSGSRAFLTLVLLWILGTYGVVSLQNANLLIEADSRSGSKAVECGAKIDPGLYAADVMLPVVDLGEEKKCGIGLAPAAPAQQPVLRMAGYEIGTPLDFARLEGAIVHNVRMTTQVFFQTVLAGFILWVMGAIGYALQVSTAYERFVLVKLIEASFKVDAAGGTNDPVLFHTPEGKSYWTSADWLFSSRLGHAMMHKAEIDLIHGAMISGLVAIFALGCAWFTFTRTGIYLIPSRMLERCCSASGIRRSARPSTIAAGSSGPRSHRMSEKRRSLSFDR